MSYYKEGPPKTKGEELSKETGAEHQLSEQKDQRAFKHLKRHLISDARIELHIKTKMKYYLHLLDWQRPKKSLQSFLIAFCSAEWG